MTKKPILLACAALIAALPIAAQTPAPTTPEYPAPSEIVAKAKTDEWVAIAPSDLLVMELAPDAKGPSTRSGLRRVVIQLMPPPFSQGWVGNIRKLAAARWWDGTSVNRVQDNYVAQWGDATEKKALPEGLVTVPESGYAVGFQTGLIAWKWVDGMKQPAVTVRSTRYGNIYPEAPNVTDAYGLSYSFSRSFAVSFTTTRHREGSDTTITPDRIWPVHCYAMVGVGRNLSPDTGSGAELYTVIGHAPRHLDRNIALVGRVIEGIEHLSSLPRGSGPLGFYEKEEERVPIISVRIGNEVEGLPAYEYLSTESESFASYADARANRRDAFFNVPAGGADICNIPVPVRRKP